MPAITCAALPPVVTALLDSIQNFPEGSKDALELDWAVHPGGLTILTGLERALGITSEHMRASYYTYMKNGNSSSATIFSVLDRMRTKSMDEHAPRGSPADHIVACAFGPGICVEVCALRRNLELKV